MGTHRLEDAHHLYIVVGHCWKSHHLAPGSAIPRRPLAHHGYTDPALSWTPLSLESLHILHQPCNLRISDSTIALLSKLISLLEPLPAEVPIAMSLFPPWDMISAPHSCGNPPPPLAQLLLLPQGFCWSLLTLIFSCSVLHTGCFSLADVSSFLYYSMASSWSKLLLEERTPLGPSQVLARVISCSRDSPEFCRELFSWAFWSWFS